MADEVIGWHPEPEPYDGPVPWENAKDGGHDFRLLPHPRGQACVRCLMPHAQWKGEACAGSDVYEFFAKVAAHMNAVADVWEQDGGDPCRVRISREYANAYRSYAEGFGWPGRSFTNG